MYCSISGEVPQEPCISTTGYLFERQLISDHIARAGTCPVTGEALTQEDLTPVKVNTFLQPRSASSGSSIPALLSTLQTEWQAQALETFELRKQLSLLKQQLSDSLYREDAAKRVIARLVRERDQARRGAVTGEAPPQQPQHEAEPMQMEEEEGLSPQLASSLGESAVGLTEARKTRSVSADLKSAEDVAAYKAVLSLQPHGNGKNAAVSTIKAHPRDASRLLSGASDGTVATFSSDSESASDVVKVGSKRVGAACFLRADNVFAAASGSEVSVWKKSGSKFQKAASFDSHTAVVHTIDVHPSLDLLFSSSKDNTWALLDVDSGTTVYTTGTGDDDAKGLPGAAIHVDGLLYGTCGGDGQLRLWDVRSRANVLTLPSHSKPGTAVAFSETGYVVATGGADGNVNLFDLRQMQGTPLFHTIAAGKVESLSFDISATYLAIAGKEVAIYALDDVDVSSVVTLKGHSKKTTGAVFGPNASFVASSSMDKTVKIWRAA